MANKTRAQREEEARALAAGGSVDGSEGGEVDAESTGLAPVVPDASAAPVKPAAGAKPEAKAVKEVIVRVSGKVQGGPAGGHHRVFSAEQHGPAFKEEAMKYAERFDGTVVDSLPGGKACPTCKRPF